MTILNQTEVDALLKSTKQADNQENNFADYQLQEPQNVSVINESANQKPTAEIGEPKRDFGVLFENKYPALELLLSRFNEFFQKQIYEQYYTKINLEYNSVSHSKFKEFAVKTDSSKTFINIYNLEPNAGFIVVYWEDDFLYNLLVYQSQIKAEHNNDLSKSWYKKNLILLFNQVAEIFSQAWNQLYPLTCSYSQSFLLDDFLKLKFSKDYGIHFNFLLKQQQNKIPFAVSFHDKLVTEIFEKQRSLNSLLNPKNKKKLLLKNLINKKVKVSAELGSYKISLQELIALEIGDIVLIDYKKGSPIFLSIADEIKFACRFLKYEEQKAVKLLKYLE